MQNLAVEVADVDAVPVAQAQFRYSGSSEVECSGASQAPQTDDEGRGGGEAGLR